MTKLYTWEEIRAVLEKELNKTKHILTYGTIGSCNIEHDIDTIITKKPDSKSSDFFKEVHVLFEKIDSYLKKKYNCKLIRTSRFSDEEETKYIAKCTPNDLVFQVLTYVSFSQIEKHWAADLNGGEDLVEILSYSSDFLLGNFSSLLESTFKRNIYDFLFIRLNDSDRINSHFPQQFLIGRMNMLFDFILRKRLGLRYEFVDSVEQIKEEFYNICDVLDDLNKKKK